MIRISPKKQALKSFLKDQKKKRQPKGNEQNMSWNAEKSV